MPTAERQRGTVEHLLVDEKMPMTEIQGHCIENKPIDSTFYSQHEHWCHCIVHPRCPFVESRVILGICLSLPDCLTATMFSLIMLLHRFVTIINLSPLH